MLAEKLLEPQLLKFQPDPTAPKALLIPVPILSARARRKAGVWLELTAVEAFAEALRGVAPTIVHEPRARGVTIALVRQQTSRPRKPPCRTLGCCCRSLSVGSGKVVLRVAGSSSHAVNNSGIRVSRVIG